MSSAPRTPTPIDPAVQAQNTAAANEQTARTQAELNRVNQVTPYGNVTFDNVGDKWTQTVTESDSQRGLREREEGLGIALGDLATEQVGKVGDILGSPFAPGGYSTRGDMGGKLDLASALGGFEDDVRNRSFELATHGLDDMFSRSEEGLRTQLANQGINAGTDAFGAEMESFNRGKGGAYADALLAADANAMNQRNQAYGEALSERQVNAGEGEADWMRDYDVQKDTRQTPLNEITSIMSGLPLTPITPGQPAGVGIAGTDMGSIYGNYNNAMMGAYNAKLGQQNANTGAAATLGAAAITVF